LLWDAVTWRRSPGRREFHLGPLFSIDTGQGHGRIALISGVIGLKRGGNNGSWRLYLFDFSSNRDKKAAGAASP
jgi:hypothetical protein